MNYGNDTGLDFAYGTGTLVPFVGNVARVSLICKDYGGFTTITATRGSDNATLRLPIDSNQNRIADAGWRSAPDGAAILDTAGVADDTDSDPSGDGTPGDGLTVFEEYRGFVVGGVHRRMNPARKDLFIHSLLPEGAGDAVALPIAVHELASGEMDTSSRIVNQNFANSGLGGAVAGRADQRGLYIVDGGFRAGGIVGTTTTSTANPESPNGVVAPIEIYTLTIRDVSPPNNNQTTVDPFDVPKTRQTIGHEVGHGTRINHWIQTQFPIGQ